MQAGIRQVDSVRPGADRAGDRGYLQKRTLRRLAVTVGLMLLAYLVGFVPAWFSAKGHEYEIDQLKSQTRLESIRTSLADAALDADRGEYEEARQESSEFFTKLRADLQRDNSIFAGENRRKAEDILSQRDDVTVHLSQKDPAVSPVLRAWYFELRDMKFTETAADAQ